MNLYAYPGYLLCSFRYFVLRLSLTIKSGVAGRCSILRVLFCIWLLQLIVYVRFLLWFSWSETNMLLDGTYASEIMSINSSPFVRSNNWMPREFVVCNITRFATGSSSIKTGLTIGLLFMLEPFEDHHGLLHRRLCCAIASSPLAAWFVMAVDLDNHLLEVDECSANRSLC